MIDFVIIISIILISFLIIRKKVKKIKNGEIGCGCGCSSCPSAKTCHNEKSESIDFKK